MTVKINLKRAERKVIPEDDYLLNITAAQQRKAKSSGEATLHLDLRVDGETHPDYAESPLYLDLSLQEQSWFRVVELCKAALGELSADDEGDFEFEPEDLIGSQIAAHVIVSDEYDGTPRNYIDRRSGSVYSPAEFRVEEEVEEEPSIGED